MDLIQQMRQTLDDEKSGKTRKGLAAKLGKHQNVVTNILKGTRRIQVDELQIIQDYIDAELPAEPTVRIVGAVGASSEEVYYANADDPAETVPAPPRASEDTVAVEIRGDSLGPGLKGWLAFYDDRHDPVTHDQLGRLCVVGLADGRVLIKIPRQARGRNYFHLYPNAGNDVLLDQKVDWAARVIHLAPKGGP